MPSFATKKVLDVTENEAKPKELEASASDEDKGQYETKLEAWEAKAAKANAILLPTISGRLMTYLENEDHPARIWTILHDRFRPTSNVTLSQALRFIATLRMADDGDMEAHIRDFTAGRQGTFG